MASFTLFETDTVAKVLQNNEYGFIGNNGQLVVSTGDAIVNNSGTFSVTVLGVVANTGQNILHQNVVANGDSMFLTVGPDAVMVAPGSCVYSVADSYTEIVNDGTMLSSSEGILVFSLATGADFSLFNNGSITGGSYGVRIGFSIETIRLINTGSITGGLYGIQHSTFDTANTTVLRNSGEVTGLTAAFLGGDGVERIFNSGLFDGDVLLAGGNDIFRNKAAGIVAGDVYGGDGDDTLVGMAGEDQFLGDGGDDILRGRGGDDGIDGGAGADTIYGGAGDDDLFGSGGADWIEGGAGDDYVSGGFGADIFAFRRNAGDDRIADFQDANDRIDLSAFGLQPGDYAARVAPALSDAGGGAIFLDLTKIGGKGSVLIEGLAFANVDASDFIL